MTAHLNQWLKQNSRNKAPAAFAFERTAIFILQWIMSEGRRFQSSPPIDGL
jgi:hypothetical protein